MVGEPSQKRSARTRGDRDRQWFPLHGRLLCADDALVKKALERAWANAPRSTHNQVGEPIDMPLVIALVHVASTRLRSDPDPDRANLVVLVDFGARVDGSVVEIEAGSAIAAETARRHRVSIPAVEVAPTSIGDVSAPGSSPEKTFNKVRFTSRCIVTETESVPTTTRASGPGQRPTPPLA